MYIENTILASFDIKFIWRDQKQRRKSEAGRASQMCFWSSLINLILIWFSNCHALLADIMAKNSITNEKQMQFFRTC